jgi:outer membrane protein insertion porin family
MYRFSEKLVRSVISFTKQFLRDEAGYMLIQNDPPQVLIDTIKKSVGVSIYFQTGRSYYVSDVKVDTKGVGKDNVSINLIKEIVAIKPGDLYSEYARNLAQVRLYRTNMFSSAFVAPNIADTIGDKVPISVSTDVGRMNELSPELILNNEDNSFNIGLALGYSRKNFLGDARLLTLQGSIAAQDLLDFITHPSLSDTNIYGYTDLRIILQQPFLFGKIIQTRMEGYLTLQKRREDYNSTLYGIKTSLDFDIPERRYFTSFIPFINYEHSNTIFRDQYFLSLFTSYFQNTIGLEPDSAAYYASLAVDSLSEESKSQKVNSSLLGFNVGANKTNDLLFPARGYALSFLIANGNLLPYFFSKGIGKTSDIPLYYKLVFTGRFFPSLYKSLRSAFGIKVKLGYIHAYDGDPTNIPINQRFTAGGSNSVRGWAARELVPSQSTKLPENLTPRELEEIFLRNAYPGGFYLLEGSIETRNRLLDEFGSALFIDFGNVWNFLNRITWKDIAVAIGFGFRYYSSFAPFRLDFGFKLYDPADQSFITDKPFFKGIQIHLGIGESF